LRDPDVKGKLTSLGKLYDSDHNGCRLIVDGEDLVVIHNHGNPLQAYRLTKDDGWEACSVATTGVGEQFLGSQRLNNRRLAFYTEGIAYDNTPVFTKGIGSLPYYTNGNLFSSQANPQRLVVRNWKPGSPIDEVGSQEFPIEGNIFTYGSYKGRVLFATNIGNVYVYNQNTLEQIRTSDGKSWQAYSILTWYDRLLIGHYPSGSLYQYDDSGLNPFDPLIPVPQTVSASAREAQTLAIYCGDLYAGVWPWGELWKLDTDTKQWQFIGRTFETPEPNKEDQEPYARAMKGKSDEYNYWGQRITSLTNYQDSLYIATMNKRGMPWKRDEHDFLDEETVAQYGRVHRYKAAAQIAVNFEWKPSTTVRFSTESGRLRVWQDGALTGEALIENSTFDVSGNVVVALGSGVYGPFSGKVSQRQKQ
jgi:hypothetical protein